MTRAALISVFPCWYAVLVGVYWGDLGSRTDLIKTDRKIFVGLESTGDKTCDFFLMRRRENERDILAIFEAEEL